MQKVQRVVVGGCAANLYKTFTTALAGEEKPPKVANHQNGNLADDSKGSGEQTSPSGVAKELDL